MDGAIGLYLFVGFVVTFFIALIWLMKEPKEEDLISVYGLKG